MKKYYTNEKHVQILISLLKEHGIRNVVASPGATNVAIVGSIQSDSYFNIYSAVDERSAAYMACGIAAETNEPVMISCTGATASRNYLPGLTEAFYRKLPVLSVTSTQIISKVGHLVAQVIDRSVLPKDCAVHSTSLPIIKDADDFWECEFKVNQALLALSRRGGGPVHINLPTVYDRSFEVKDLPKIRAIRRIVMGDEMPKLEGKVSVFVGAHRKWTVRETEALDRFCATNNAVVFCDHTSSYKGKYRTQFALAASQIQYDKSVFKSDVFIHIGEVSGDYPTLGMSGKHVWRVSEDGELRDTFRKLRYVFEMSELQFFEHYSNKEDVVENTYFKRCNEYQNELRNRIPDVPFSNIWLASRMADKIPADSVVHFGILNSLRAWNMFELPKSVDTASNTGGFGIDGILSTLLGASLVNNDKLYFCVLGDLAFFYDMNAIGNRHVGNNLRILLINNGKGTEFRNYGHHAARFGEDADEFMAAAGHFGNRSSILVKSYVEALGFEYMSANDKHEFDQVHARFLTPGITEKPMVFEVFTNSDDESKALEMMMNIEQNSKAAFKAALIERTKEALGGKMINKMKALKKIIKE